MILGDSPTDGRSGKGISDQALTGTPAAHRPITTTAE